MYGIFSFWSLDNKPILFDQTFYAIQNNRFPGKQNITFLYINRYSCNKGVLWI